MSMLDACGVSCAAGARCGGTHTSLNLFTLAGLHFRPLYTDRRSRELAGRLDLIGKVRGKLALLQASWPILLAWPNQTESKRSLPFPFGLTPAGGERGGQIQQMMVLPGHYAHSAIRNNCSPLPTGGEGGGQGQQPDGGRRGRDRAQEGGVAPGEPLFVLHGCPLDVMDVPAMLSVCDSQPCSATGACQGDWQLYGIAYSSCNRTASCFDLLLVPSLPRNRSRL